MFKHYLLRVGWGHTQGENWLDTIRAQSSTGPAGNHQGLGCPREALPRDRTEKVKNVLILIKTLINHHTTHQKVQKHWYFANYIMTCVIVQDTVLRAL